MLYLGWLLVGIGAGIPAAVVIFVIVRSFWTHREGWKLFIADFWPWFAIVFLFGSLLVGISILEQYYGGR